jgi:hypothetical protein
VGRQASPGICEDAGGPIAGEHYAIAAHCVEGTMAVAKLRVFLGRVEDSMSYLMAFQGDHLIDAACKACPDLANEIHEGSERGDSPLRLASELLRIMFVAEIEKLPADQRELLATYLAFPREAPPSTFASSAESIAAKSTPLRTLSSLTNNGALIARMRCSLRRRACPPKREAMTECGGP